MNIGRRIYTDKATGALILDIGERSGDIIETTVEDDMIAYKAIAERVPETLVVTELEYGAHAQDFQAGGILLGIDTITGELLFSYPDPENNTPQPQPQALSVTVASLEKELEIAQGNVTKAQEDLTITQMALVDTYEQLVLAQEENTSTQMALVEVYELMLMLMGG